MFHQKKLPAWYSKIKPLLKNGTENNFSVESKSLIVIIKAPVRKDTFRFFAITYGYGRGLLNKDKIEYDFGLIACLNSIDETKIKKLYKRNIDTQAKSSKEAFSIPAVFDLFSVEKTVDIISRITGSCNAELDLGIKISGADSVKLTSEITYREIPNKCKELYNAYRKTNYKKRFPFIDYVKHEKDKTVLRELENSLWDAIDQRNQTHLSLAYTSDEMNLFDVYQVEYQLADTRSIYNDLTTDILFNFLNQKAITRAQFKNIKIVPLNQNGIPIAETEKINKYVVFETEFNHTRYILSNGKWYKVDKDYVNRINIEVDALFVQHQCKTPNLKTWSKVAEKKSDVFTYNETSYNSSYHGIADYVVLDRQLFGRTVEAADLYYKPDNKMICIKRWHASATLSHLFQQAYVSAKLILEDDAYRKSVCNQLTVSENDLRKATFVLAIGTETPTKKISEILPLFSKITLAKCIRDMRSLGYNTEIYLLPMM